MRQSLPLEWTRDEYLVTTNPKKISLDLVHQFLSNESTWARNIPRPTVARAIEHSLCFALFKHETQIGFARVITDYATIAYLGDVFVLAAHRGLGLSSWLMTCVVNHPDLQALRRWMLLTSDAHGLYKKSGFTALVAPSKWMEKFNVNVYTDLSATAASTASNGNPDAEFEPKLL